MGIKVIMQRRRLAAWLGIGIAIAAIGSAVGLAASNSNGRGSSGVLPPAKQKILDQQEAARVNAPVLAHPDLSPPPPPHLSARIPGIVNTGLNVGPFPPSLFTVQNVWNGPRAGVWYLVYAGGTPDSTGVVTGGGVRIYSLPINPNAPNQELAFVGASQAPTSSVLKIVGVNGDLVDLSDAAGNRMSFNLSTMTFG